MKIGDFFKLARRNFDEYIIVAFAFTKNTKFISYVTNLSLEEERKKELEFEVGSDWRGEIKNAS